MTEGRPSLKRQKKCLASVVFSQPISLAPSDQEIPEIDPTILGSPANHGTPLIIGIIEIDPTDYSLQSDQSPLSNWCQTIEWNQVEQLDFWNARLATSKAHPSPIINLMIMQSCLFGIEKLGLKYFLWRDSLQ